MLTKKQIQEKINEVKNSKEVKDIDAFIYIYNGCLNELRRYMSGEYNNDILEHISKCTHANYIKKLGVYTYNNNIQRVVDKLNDFIKVNKDKFGDNEIEIYIGNNINYDTYEIFIDIKTISSK